MTFEAFYSHEAARRLREFDAHSRKRMLRAIERLVDRPEIGKPLSGPLSGRWSFRVGNWRVLYKIYSPEKRIVILTIGHRREVYLRST